MGLKKLGRGIAAAGAVMGVHFSRKEAQDKQDAIRKEEVARQDNIREERDAENLRRFEIQRKDQALRNQTLEMQNLLVKTELNHKMIVDTAAKTDYNPIALQSVMSENSGDNFVYRYNEAESRKGSAKSIGPGGDGRRDRQGVGDDSAISFDIGTYRELADGTHAVDPTSGQKIIDPLPGKDFTRKTFANKDDFVQFINDMANPSELLARQKRKQTIAETRESARWLQEMKDNSESGKAATDLDIAKAEKLRADAAQTATGSASKDTTYKTPLGEKSYTSQAMTTLRDNMKKLDPDGDMRLTDRDAVIYEQINTNEDVRDGIRDGARMYRDDDSKKTRDAIVRKIATKLTISNKMAEALIKEQLEFMQPAEGTDSFFGFGGADKPTD